MLPSCISSIICFLTSAASSLALAAAAAAAGSIVGMFTKPLVGSVAPLPCRWRRRGWVTVTLAAPPAGGKLDKLSDWFLALHYLTLLTILAYSF